VKASLERNKINGNLQSNANEKGMRHFTVICPKAYFFNEPNLAFKRKGYLVGGDVIDGLKIEEGFVQVVYNDTISRKVTKGWIEIKCLQ